MFTVDQIATLHSKVKSGADFPKFIQDLKKIGVTSFETWVEDSHTVYFGANDFQTKSNPKYEKKIIANTSDQEKFTYSLKIHQKGETDYLTFCNHSAESGVEKWLVNLNDMTCTYFDKANNEILFEKIPEA